MKVYRVFAISDNRNSFGLRSCLLIARDGEAWVVLSNDVNLPKRHVSYCVQEAPQVDLTADTWTRNGWECPRRLSLAPKAVIDAAWSGLESAHAEA
jgi:hypothetical protein